MRKTHMSQKDVDALIKKLMREWPGARYDILQRNCCHFSNELCKRLGVGSLPDWVTSLAGIGADLRNLPQAVEDLAINGMEAIVDLWQAPQQFTDVRPRQEPAKHHMQGPHERRGAPVDNPYGDFNVGDRVEVFSNSRQVWCNGKVDSFTNKNPMERIMVTVAFRIPGAASDEIMYKDLPVGSKEVRRAKRGGC